MAKENAEQSNQRRTQSRESGSSGLDRVREAAKKDRKIRFTALLHHVSDDRLRERRSATGATISYVSDDQLRDSNHSLKKKAAPGVDGVTRQE